MFDAMMNPPEIPESEMPEFSKIPDEGIFLFSVTIPCQLHYYELPGNLFRKARLGNVDVLCKLLRIDKSVIGDRRISEHVARLGADPKSPDFQKVVTALKGLPQKLGRKKVKMFVASYFYGLAKHLGEPVSYVQFQELYDKSAKERGLGEIDPDLMMSPGSFETAMRRHIQFWAKARTGQI